MNIPEMIAKTQGHHIPVILTLGLALFLGTVGARVFQKLRIPQVVGVIIIGLLIGQAGLIDSEIIAKLGNFNMFALGIIGFMIGGELKLDVFRKYGRQFMMILLCEGLITFVLVSILVTVAYRLIAPESTWQVSIAIGLVLGAIASATAPAATVDVLWEYKTRGPLTRTVLAIVALDDGLALLIFGFASSAAAVLAGSSNSEQTSVVKSILMPFYEIFGAVILGLVTGLVLVFVLKYILEPDKILTFTLASVMLIIGLSHALGVDSILAAMTLGAAIANGLPLRSKSTFQLVEKFAPPIYVLFFVLVGAGMQVQSMQWWIVAIAVVYILGRTGGKFFGSWFGAKISNAPASVRKYCGMCLFSQAGVAIGLSIIAGSRFEGSIGKPIILIVTATTFIVQIIGPACVKVAVHKAGEAGRNITEEDLVKSYTVGDVTDYSPTTIHQALTLSEILNTFTSSDTLYYPVVDEGNKLLGVITIDGIKESLAHQESLPWLLACDLMLPVVDVLNKHDRLEESLEEMKGCGIENLCVVDDGGVLLGIIDIRVVNRKLSAELLARQETSNEQNLVTA